MVGIPDQRQVIRRIALRCALAHQITRPVEHVVHALIDAFARPGGQVVIVAAYYLARLYLLHFSTQPVAGRVVEVALDPSLRVDVLQQAPDSVVAVLVHALRAVAAAGQVATAVIVVASLEQRRSVLQYRLRGQQVTAVVGELAL
ncbi:hypothetical protein G6F35_016364 [Rhizopus arrhizus]|nr:hypothetical protein G6F35_016364 [Rhizopus arrhizus]